MDTLFNPEMPEERILEELRQMRFVPVGEGHAARVYGDTHNRIVLKVFPPLRIGSAREVQFIQRNAVLRYVDRFTVRWGRLAPVRWVRSSAKAVLARCLSRRNPDARKRAGDRYIEGYRACIAKGVMDGLPTRIIPNWLPQLDVNVSRLLRPYLAKPREAIMQQRFPNDAVVGAVLEATCRDGAAIEECCALVEKAVGNMIQLWQHGLADLDGRFPIFDNQVVLPDGTVQLFDANNISASREHAFEFVRAKEEELAGIITRLNAGDYPQLLFDTEAASVADTGRLLYQRLPKQMRDPLVKHYLQSAADVLSERTFIQNWQRLRPVSAAPGNAP